MPNTIAAMKPNDRSAASTFSLIESSIVASIPATLFGGSFRYGRGPHRIADPKRVREGLPSEKVFAVQERARTFVIYNQTAGKLGIAATGVWFARKNAYLLVASSRENLMELHQM